jgi:hypothetical protein
MPTSRKRVEPSMAFVSASFAPLASISLGLDFPQSDLGGGLVTRAYRIGQYCDVFPPGQQPQSRRLDGAFHRPANQNEFIRPQFAEHSVGAGLFEGVYRAFFKYDLVVFPEYVARQIGTAVGSKADAPFAHSIADLLGSVGAFKAAGAVFSAVVIDAGSRDHANIFQPGPRHNPSNVGQDPPMVSDAGSTCGNEKFPLRINID